MNLEERKLDTVCQRQTLYGQHGDGIHRAYQYYLPEIEKVSRLGCKKNYRIKLKWINVAIHNFGLDHANGLNIDTWEDPPLTWRRNNVVGVYAPRA